VGSWKDNVNVYNLEKDSAGALIGTI
jgi:WD40 repeat protein